LIVLVVAMVGEVTIFLTITAIVSRPRPDVARLDGAPPTSSFPSGHTFARSCCGGRSQSSPREAPGGRGSAGSSSD
jgi:undecaprenyl-diphosphatase